MRRVDFYSIPQDELRELLAENGFPSYRTSQIAKWCDSDVTRFDRMTNLPASLRTFLEEKFYFPSVKIEKRLVSSIDDTVKYLYALEDGQTIESVLMHYKHGWSQCLSTQVGCKMDCTFCATGRGGYMRNLSPSEMLSQIDAAQKDRGIRVSSIVLMGMGEPLDNFDNVLRFLEVLAAPGGINIGMRHVSLSTCGLVDGIVRLMEKKLQITLSVSLHAPNDKIRLAMMPVTRRWPVDELLSVCRDYARTTGRRISFEYAMVDGINDSDVCADELAAKLKHILCHVNLIPLNSVEGTGYRKSSLNRLHSFKKILMQNGINVTVRRTLGADIDASCGQLKQRL